MFGVGAFRIASAPHQSLSLDVDQTALNQNSRPQRPQDSHHSGYHDRSAAQQALFFELSTKRIKVAGAFGHLRGSIDNRAVLSFHHGKDPFTPVDIGPVQKKMSMSSPFDLLGGRMFKPILDDPPNRAHTVAALNRNLLTLYPSTIQRSNQIRSRSFLLNLFFQTKLRPHFQQRNRCLRSGLFPCFLTRVCPQYRQCFFHHPITPLLKAFNISMHNSPSTNVFPATLATLFGHYSHSERSEESFFLFAGGSWNSAGSPKQESFSRSLP